jgi:hypothetical protein
VENSFFDLPTISSAHPMHLLQIIKKRAIREDKVKSGFKFNFKNLFIFQGHLQLPQRFLGKIRFGSLFRFERGYLP